MKKNLSSGMSLVEVLAVIVVGFMATILIFNVLFTMLKNEDRIATNNQVRDVADYYLESLANSIYSFHEDNFAHFEESVEKGTYIVSQDGKKTGFVKENNGIKIYVENKVLEATYPNITISEDSKMTRDKNTYKIKLVLTYNDKSTTFNKEVHSIAN